MKNPNGIDIEQAYRDHARYVARIVSSRVNTSRETIEDACQFAWAQAWRYRANLRPEPELLRAWLVKVAEREAWRLHADTPALGVEDDAASTAVDAPARDALAEREQRLQALDLIGRVSPYQQRVLVLWSAGYTYDEIAKRLGITVNAVNKALQRAQTSLRRQQ